MREIKNVTQEIEKQAYDKVEGFDHTQLCYKTIFELMNNNGVFIKAFNELTTFYIEDKSQVELKTFKYGFVEERDGCVYPMVEMIISLKDKVYPFRAFFCLTLTPFNAGLDDEFKKAGVYGGCDNELTKIWRIIMKSVFEEKWVEAFKSYCCEVKNLRDSEIATKAEIEYLKNEKKYESEMASIF